MIGPVFQLRYLGVICPCLEKPENEAARKALTSLTGLPIRYHRKTRTDGESTLSSAMSSVSGLFGGSKGSRRDEESSGGGTTYVKERAALTVMDTLSGPALFVETEPDATAAANGDVDEEGNVIDVDTRHRKTVPLKKIGKVVQGESGFLGMGGGPSLAAVMGIGNKHIKGSGDELLRFNVLNAAGKKVESSDRRDEVINNLMVLVEWDRRRREGLPDDDGGENGDNDEENGFENDEEVGGKRKGAPKGRAAKAAYFAKREIELTKQRREREKRKARYLEGSGGLKYTAVAMANREIT